MKTDVAGSAKKVTLAISVYDNGGKTPDWSAMIFAARYTVGLDVAGDIEYFAMSENPSAANGVNMYLGSHMHDGATAVGRGRLVINALDLPPGLIKGILGRVEQFFSEG